MTTIKKATVNENGYKQIEAALNEHGKLKVSEFHRPAEVVRQYAWDAENSFESGNDCSFEISPMDTLTGRPVTVVITADGYEVSELDDE